MKYFKTEFGYYGTAPSGEISPMGIEISKEEYEAHLLEIMNEQKENTDE